MSSASVLRKYHQRPKSSPHDAICPICRERKVSEVWRINGVRVCRQCARRFILRRFAVLQPEFFAALELIVVEYRNKDIMIKRETRPLKPNRRTFIKTAVGVAAVGGAAFLAPRPSQSQTAKARVVKGKATRSGKDHEVDRSGIIHFRNMHKSDVGEGFPPDEDKRVTLENWAYTSTAHWRYTHLNFDHVFKTTRVDRGNGRIWTLPRKMINPEALLQATVLWGRSRELARRITVAEWLKLSEIDSLVAAHDGHIVAEIYCGKMRSNTAHPIWCGGKSVVASLMACYLADGTLNRDSEITDYLPELKKTAFKGATLGQVMDQTTGVLAREAVPLDEFEAMSPEERKHWDWGTAEFQRANHALAINSRASGLFPKLPNEPVMGIYDFIYTLKENNWAHGTRFEYKDVNNFVAQLALERKTRTPFLTHLKRQMRALGFENNPIVLLDQIGTPVGGFGLAFATRDWLRWGEMMRTSGRIGGGVVLPGIERMVETIVKDTGADRLKASGFYAGPWPNPGYKAFHWTNFNHPGAGVVFDGVGGWHQRCSVDHTNKNTVVITGSFWDSAPDKLARKDTGDTIELSDWSFVNEVLPALTR
jgi:CubicO group peptidase (beta-lactamase class C family)